MKKNVRDTSLTAFYEIKDLGKKEQEVYRMYKRFPKSTDREIAVKLGYADPNKVRPRRNSLVEQGLMVECGKRECTISGKTVLTWCVNLWRGESLFPYYKKIIPSELDELEWKSFGNGRKGQWIHSEDAPYLRDVIKGGTTLIGKYTYFLFAGDKCIGRGLHKTEENQK